MKKTASVVLAVILIFLLAACASGEEPQKHGSAAEPSVSYSYTEYPLERNGIDLHLDRISVTGSNPDRNILLIHGVT